MLVKISDKTIIVASKVKRLDLITGVGCQDSVTINLGKGETVSVSAKDFDVTGEVLLEMVATAIKRALDGGLDFSDFGLPSPRRAAVTTIRPD
jgi:hypothetical protein